MPAVRPYRDHDIYCAPCVTCGMDVESDTLPVPTHCKKHWGALITKPDNSGPPCRICGRNPCPYKHEERH